MYLVWYLGDQTNTAEEKNHGSLQMTSLLALGNYESNGPYHTNCSRFIPFQFMPPYLVLEHQTNAI